MAEIDQKADCSGHNYQMGGEHPSLSDIQRVENIRRDGVMAYMVEAMAKVTDK